MRKNKATQRKMLLCLIIPIVLASVGYGMFYIINGKIPQTAPIEILGIVINVRITRIPDIAFFGIITVLNFFIFNYSKESYKGLITLLNTLCLYAMCLIVGWTCIVFISLLFFVFIAMLIFTLFLIDVIKKQKPFQLKLKIN